MKLIICPNCGFEQIPCHVCIHCGISLEKYIPLNNQDLAPFWHEDHQGLRLNNITYPHYRTVKTSRFTKTILAISGVFIIIGVLILLIANKSQQLSYATIQDVLPIETPQTKIPPEVQQEKYEMTRKRSQNNQSEGTSPNQNTFIAPIPKSQQPQLITQQKGPQPVIDIPSSPRTLGISYEQIMRYPERYFSIKETTPMKGQKRYLGISADGIAIIEIVGEKSDVSEASMMIEVSPDPDTSLRAATATANFFVNMIPEWREGTYWLANAVKKFASSHRNSTERIRSRQGNKIISIGWFIDIGMIDITIRPAVGKQDPRFKRDAPIYTTTYPRNSFSILIQAIQRLGIRHWEYGTQKTFTYIPVTQASSPSYIPCLPSKTCSELSSCDEARYHFFVCRNTELDPDHDFIPCESLCR